MVYWCRFFDAGGWHVFGAEKLEAADDAEVIAKARGIFLRGVVGGFEIWDGKRLVLRHSHGNPLAEWRIATGAL